MPNTTDTDTKIVQKFTQEPTQEFQAAYYFSLCVKILIWKKWFDIEISKAFIESIIFIVKIGGGGEVNVENVINMLVPAIASRIGIEPPQAQYEIICSRIYDVLIEANIKKMVEVSIDEIKNHAIHESLPIDGIYH